MTRMSFDAVILTVLLAQCNQNILKTFVWHSLQSSASFSSHCTGCASQAIFNYINPYSFISPYEMPAVSISDLLFKRGNFYKNEEIRSTLLSRYLSVDNSYIYGKQIRSTMNFMECATVRNELQIFHLSETCNLDDL